MGMVIQGVDKVCRCGQGVISEVGVVSVCRYAHGVGVVRGCGQSPQWMWVWSGCG